jgi:uncharacterized RDD family membrane protein YckC
MGQGAALKLSPMLEEFLVATVAIVALLAFISLLYWLFTGSSPWPELVLAQAMIYGSGIGVLTLTSPRRRS